VSQGADCHVHVRGGLVWIAFGSATCRVFLGGMAFFLILLTPEHQNDGLPIRKGCIIWAIVMSVSKRDRDDYEEGFRDREKGVLEQALTT